MKFGAVFPQTELGGDAGAARAYVEAVSNLGFGHLAIFDHVIGADPDIHEGWSGPYDINSTFHEPFVFFGYLAALSSLELVCSIVILPQRQTVLVAKQAAEIDLLSGGRFRLGVGIGWNPVEYEALGKDFTNRGARLSEQIGLMRRLWTEKSVTFDGNFERVTGAGIAPPPIQRPIPIWIGGSNERALRRIGQLADGWFPQAQPGPDLEEMKVLVHAAAREAGRDPASLGMEGRIKVDTDDMSEIASRVRAWDEAGASHVSFSTMGQRHTGVGGHVASLVNVAGILP